MIPLLSNGEGVLGGREGSPSAEPGCGRSKDDVP